MIKNILIILLVTIAVSPVFAHIIQESDSSHKSLQKAIHIDDPQVSQVFYETIRFDQRHFYTFDAAQGETIHLEILIPLLKGLEDYKPTMAFYKIGDSQKEFLRYTPVMFFGEIPAERTIFYERFGQANYYLNQKLDLNIQQTGTYVIEIFDEGNCIVIIDSMTEKKCAPEMLAKYFEVIQGKYAFVIGTLEQNTFQDNINGWIQTRIFFEDPIGNFINSISKGGVIETGGSPEDIHYDDFRWFVLLVLLITTIVLIWKRDYLRGKMNG
jgi:hypothetical protein